MPLNGHTVAHVATMKKTKNKSTNVENLTTTEYGAFLFEYDLCDILLKWVQQSSLRVAATTEKIVQFRKLLQHHNITWLFLLCYIGMSCLEICKAHPTTNMS